MSLQKKWKQLIRSCIKENGRVWSKTIFQDLIDLLPKEYKKDLIQAFEDAFGVSPKQ